MTKKKPNTSPKDSPIICPRLNPREKNESAVCDKVVPPIAVMVKAMSVVGAFPARSVIPARQTHPAGREGHV